MAGQTRPDLLATTEPPRAIPTVVGGRQNKQTREQKIQAAGRRLVSLDAYRGFIMIMLAANGFGIAALAKLKPDNSVWDTFSIGHFQSLAFHFNHPAWESLRGRVGVSFWDLIQPSFMFMVGVAMPLSYARRTVMGSTARGRLLHAAWRAVVLTLMGVFLYSLRSPQTNWVFTNVLAQIGLGYFFAYLLLSVSVQSQLIAFAAILFGYWGWFMLNPPPADFDYSAVRASVEEGEVYEGRFAPWSKNANAAHFFDVWLLNVLRSPESAGTSENSGKESTADASNEAVTTKPGGIRRWFFSAPERYEFNSGGYTTLNFIPSIATTLLGILCGQLLMGTETSGRKLLTLVVMGAVCLALGVLAHHTVCPIVKRIWTPSWVLFSGGYVIWLLAGFYFVFDILPFQRLAFPLVVVGMNSIAMYLMGQLLRPWVTDNIVTTHFGGVLTSLFGPSAVSNDGWGAIVLPTATFVVFWLVAYWMYRNRYFVRV
ncbi:MAG: hypothetical protein R3C59_13555 [Planctomycetaceae bacterium]